MSNAKFTPGPWRVGDTCVMDSSEKPVCMPLGMNEKYNADLIAAAPDMYEMLEWLSAEFDYGDDHDGVIESVENVLAKARGEE